MATTGTNEITQLLDQMIGMYKPGGGFGETELALLGRAKTKSLATTAQNLVSSGLSGTTVGVSAGKNWEEEIGMPARLKLEDTRTQRLMEAMTAKAGYLERAKTAADQTAYARQTALDKLNADVRARSTANYEASRDYMRQLFPDILGGGGGGGGGSSTVQTSQGSSVGAAPSLGGSAVDNTPWPSYAKGYGPEGEGTYYGKAMFDQIAKPEYTTSGTVPNMDQFRKLILSKHPDAKITNTDPVGRISFTY